jgi:hypothetical protein
MDMVSDNRRSACGRTRHAAGAMLGWLLILVVSQPSLVYSQNDSRKPFQDHLLPVKGEVDDSYMGTLKRKLFVTRADFGRITSLGDGNSGEWSLAIHTDKNSKNYIATCTRADYNLGTATWALNPNRVDESAIKINRMDSPIARSTAEAVLRALHVLLRSRAKREATGRATDITFDGLRVIFFVPTDINPSQGLMVPESRGPRIQKALELEELARVYCEAHGRQERQAAATKLERLAQLIAPGK